MHAYAMDAHKMHAREMQPHKIYTYGVRGHCMHAREIHTCKYILMGCTPEITALIFPKVHLKLVLIMNNKSIGRRGVRWHMCYSSPEWFRPILAYRFAPF